MATAYNLQVNQLAIKDRQYPADGKHAYNLHYWGTRITEAINEQSATSTLSGSGVVPQTAEVCLLTTTGASQAIFLGPGNPKRKRIRIIHHVDGGSGIMTNGSTCALTAAITTITFTNVYDWVELVWNITNSVWDVVGYYGVTIA